MVADRGGFVVDDRCAGIDWAKDEHALCVLDGVGVRIEQRRFVHDERGLAELCQTLRHHGVGRVAIERPEGVVVERLLDAGLLAVMAIHPNQLKAARPRFRASGGKSDAFDAFCLAELARTDHHRFRVLAPDSDETKAIRVLTRAREDLVNERVAVANRLRAELEAFWPAPARLFRDLDSPISLAFLERYPSPRDTRSLGEKRLAAFLAKNGYRGRKKQAGELMERLRSAPGGRAGEAETEARRAVVLSLVAALRSLVAGIKDLSARTAQAVRSHPDGAIFLSLFRSPRSTLTAARLLAEIGDGRERYPGVEALAADAGMSPVAKESGRTKVASFRRACDKRLRDAFATLADSSRHHNAWAKDIYGRARERGCTHPHAIRVLGRAWVRVIWRMWQDGLPYDPDKHGGLRRLEMAES